MEVSRSPLSIDKIAVHPRLVNPIELPLVSEEICLSQRPGLCHGQPVQLVANLKQAIILALESFIDFSLSGLISA